MRKKSKIVVSIFLDGNFLQLKEKLKMAKLEGAEIAEIRADSWPEIEEDDLLRLKEITKDSKMPLIFTLRDKKEGGKYNFPFEKKLNLIKKALFLNFDYLDVELKFLEKLKKNVLDLKGNSKTKIILSYHNLKDAESIKGLREIKRRMIAFKPDIIKLAIFSRSQKTNQNILKIIKETKREGKNIIGIALGEIGREARLKALSDNYFSYFCLTEKERTAGGQIPLRFINLRKKLDKIKKELIYLEAKRKKIVLEIGKIKEKNKLPKVDKKREKEELKMIEVLAKKKELNPILAKKIIRLLIEDAKRVQKENLSI